MSQSYCIVQGCRFPSTHLTSSHKCGKCGKFGHGQAECHNSFMIDQLKSNSVTIKLPHALYCKSLSCPCPWSHTSESHYCSQCQERHLESACRTGCVIMGDPIEIRRVIQEASKLFGTKPEKIYTTIYAGQGSMWYAKRNDSNKPISLFFMHSDSWGQCGPKADDREKLKNFCNGYRDFESGKFLVI